jgi:hypothetical protein
MLKVLGRKIILAKEGFDKTPAGQFFVKNNFEIVHEYNKDLKDNYVFILDDYLLNVEEVSQLNRISSSFDEEKIHNLKGTLDFYYIKNRVIDNFFGTYFNSEDQFDLLDHYSKNFKELMTVKIQEYLNVGYKENFKIGEIRKYLNNALSFCFDNKLISKDTSPVDINYSSSGEVFVIQIIARIPGFSFDEKFINNRLVKNSIVSHSNFSDISYLDNSKKIVISGVWFKSEDLVDFRSYFTHHHDIKKKKHIAIDKVLKLENIDLNFKLEFDEQKNEELNVSSYQRFALFVVKTQEEKKDFNLENITEDNTRKILSTYNENDKEFEFDDKSIAQITIIAQKILSQKIGFNKLLEKVINPDAELVKDFYKVNGKAGVDELKDEIIKVASNGELDSDQFIRIVAKALNKSEDDVDNYITKITGKAESDHSSEVQKIQSLNEDFNRTLELQKLVNELELKSSKIQDQNVKMKKIIDQMKVEYLKQKQQLLAQPNSSNVNNDGNVIEINSQNKIDSEKIIILENNISELKNREKLYAKLKTDLEQILFQKDIKISQLESKVDQFKNEKNLIKENETIEKVNTLENENKSLHLRLEQAMKNIANMNSNIDHKEKENHIKKEKEIDLLKSQLNSVQNAFEKLRIEKFEIDEKYKVEKEVAKKLKEEKLITSMNTALQNNQHDSEKSAANESAKIATERRGYEEKLKSMSMEVKKSEHKIKLLQVQLEESNRKKPGAPGSAKSNDAYIKQLEVANSKLVDASVEIMDKKKELIKAKQENTQLVAKIAELEKKIINADKKAA